MDVIWTECYKKLQIKLVTNSDEFYCFSCHTDTESSLDIATSADMKKNHHRFHGAKENWRDFELPGDTLYFTYQPAGTLPVSCAVIYVRLNPKYVFSACNTHYQCVSSTCNNLHNVSYISCQSGSAGSADSSTGWPGFHSRLDHFDKILFISLIIGCGFRLIQMHLFEWGHEVQEIPCSSCWPALSTLIQTNTQ